MNRKLALLTIGLSVFLFACSPLLLGNASFAASGQIKANHTQPTQSVPYAALSPAAAAKLGIALPKLQAGPAGGADKYLCSTPVDYFGDYATPGAEVANTVGPANGGAFVLSWGTGSIFYCNKGAATLVASGVSGQGSFGLAMVGNTAYVTEYSGLLETCTGVTTTASSGTCTVTSIDSTYCSSLPGGFCNADGDAVVGSTLYYADIYNGVVTQCNLAATSCSTQYSFGGYVASPYGYPVNIAYSGGNQYVVNDDCASTSGSQVWINGANSPAYDFNCNFATGQNYDYLDAEGLTIGPAGTAIAGDVLVSQYVYDQNTGAEQWVIQDFTTSHNDTTVKVLTTSTYSPSTSNIQIAPLGKTIVYSEWLNGEVFTAKASTHTWTF
jgi:hypothetical protein